MTENEIEEIKEIEETKNSYPVIDFIETTPVNEFEFGGRMYYIQY